MPTDLDYTVRDVTAELMDDSNLCAWGGCTARFNGTAMPADWATVTIEVRGNVRQLSLCPTHDERLDELLKEGGVGLNDWRDDD
jgi:hypothetical protein